MPNYRMYLLDQDGKFCDVRQIVAEADEDASSQAKAIGEGQRWELWLDSKMIGQSQPKNGT